MLKVGTTEGRFRMIMPDLMASFENIQSGNHNNECTECKVDKQIQGFIGDAVNLRNRIASGDLDLAFSGLTPQMPSGIESRLLYEEHLFFVISENLLRIYQPDFLSASERTVDLRDFRSVPVCRSLPDLHCMKILDALLDRIQLSLNCVHVSGHFDLHQELAVRDYAACFCLGMYLPNVQRINNCSKNKLHVFRIKGLTETNPVYLLRKKTKKADHLELLFIQLLEEKCREITLLQDRI